MKTKKHIKNLKLSEKLTQQSMIEMEAIIEAEGDLAEAAEMLEMNVIELRKYMTHIAQDTMSWPGCITDMKIDPLTLAYLIWQKFAGIQYGLQLALNPDE